MATMETRKSQLPPLSATESRTGTALTDPYSDFFSQLEDERYEVTHGRRWITKEERFIAQMVSRMSSDARWRESLLLQFQQRRNQARLELQQTLSNPSVAMVHSLLNTQRKAQSMRFDIRGPKRYQDTWTDARHHAATTILNGFQTNEKVKTSKGQQEWVTEHMSRVLRQIGNQRRKEAAVAENMEMILMAHEEQRQKKSEQVLKCTVECTDFVDFLVLVHRYGSVPDWQVFAFGQERFGRLPGRRYQRRIIRAARKIQSVWNGYWVRWRPTCLALAIHGQRLYRGYIGRRRAAIRKTLICHVNQGFNRHQARLVSVCFQSWDIYRHRSKRIRRLMRRISNQLLGKAFRSFMESVKENSERRAAKLRIHLARIAHQTIIKVLHQWHKAARQARAVRRFTVRIISGTKLRCFEHWQQFNLISKSVRENMKHAVTIRLVSQAVARYLARIKIQKLVRGRLGRRAVRAIRQKRALHSRMAARKQYRQEALRISKEKYEQLVSTTESAFHVESQEMAIQIAGLQKSYTTKNDFTAAFQAEYNELRAMQRRTLTLWARFKITRKARRREIAHSLRRQLMDAAKAGIKLSHEADLLSRYSISGSGIKLLRLWASTNSVDPHMGAKACLEPCSDLLTWIKDRHVFPAKFHSWACSNCAPYLNIWFWHLPLNQLGAAICVGVAWPYFREFIISTLDETDRHKLFLAYILEEIKDISNTIHLTPLHTIDKT